MNYIRCNNQIAIWLKQLLDHQIIHRHLCILWEEYSFFIFDNNCFTDDQNCFELWILDWINTCCCSLANLFLKYSMLWSGSLHLSVTYFFKMLLISFIVIIFKWFTNCNWSIFYLELFDTAFHACGWHQEGHPVVKKTLLQYINTPGKGALWVQPYRKTDYKPMMMLKYYQYKYRKSSSYQNATIATIFLFAFSGTQFMIAKI